MFATASVHSTLSYSAYDAREDDADAEDGQKPKLSKRDNLLRLVSMGLMALVLVGFGLCQSLFAPFFPTEAARRGVSATVVGLIFSSFTLVMFVGSFVSGLLVRTLGIHFMVWAGTLLSGGATVLFGLLDMAPEGDSYIVICFVTRLVEGIGASLYSTAAYTCASALFPESTATGYAILETAVGTGMMVGPTIGGALFNAGGFPLPFYVVGGILLAFGFISAFLLRLTLSDNLLSNLENSTQVKKSKKTKKNKARPPTANFLATLQSHPIVHFYRSSGNIWLFSVSLVSLAIIFSYPTPTLALYFESLGLSDAFTVGLVFLAGSLSYTILALLVGKFADTFPNHLFETMAVGGVVLSASSFFLGPIAPIQSAVPPSIALTIGSYIACGVGLAIIINATPVGIFAAVRSAGLPEGLETSSLVAGLYNAMWYLGTFAGTPLAGLFMDTVGFEWGSFSMSIIGFCLTIAFVVQAISTCLRRRSKRQDPTPRQSKYKHVEYHIKNRGDDEEQVGEEDSVLIPSENRNNEPNYNSIADNDR